MWFKKVTGFFKNTRSGCYVVSSRLTRFSRTTERNHSKLSYMHHVGSSPLQYISMGQALQQAAERWPDRPAVISRHEDRRLTYSQLVEEVTIIIMSLFDLALTDRQSKLPAIMCCYDPKLADKFGAGLKKLGMTTGDRLGIWSPNCTQWVVALMAAARSGFISVAINPLYQNRELKHCLKKVGVKTLVALETTKNDNYYNLLTEIIPELHSSKHGQIESQKFENLKNIVIVTDKEELPGVLTYKKVIESASDADAGNISRNVNNINPDSPCNIQFTSGTTGLPKAPILTHYNIVNNGYNVGRRNELDNGHKTICLQVPLFHVFGLVISVSAGFQHGATLVFPSAKYSTKSNIEALLAEKCNIIHGTPTMHIDLVNEVRAKGISGIKAEIAVTGGSPVTPQLVQNMSKVLGVNRVKSVFGMTEGTAVNFQSLPGEEVEKALYTVGHIQDHLEVKIVDEKDNIVPFGTTGELLVRGYSTMVGYWDDDVKTKETITDEGWLRSGDQVVLNENGYGRIVGRIKDLIIRGGENIAPKEIEDIISTYPDVVECQVFGVNDERLGEEVCATIRLKDGSVFDDQKIKKHCAEHLAKFKVPKMFKQVDAFPKTASGKVQKFKLRKMVEDGHL